MPYTIIIPIYNEKQNIFNLINEINNVFGNLSYLYEIVVINDGSNDLDKDDLDILSNFKNTKIYSNYTKMGQSYSIFEGVIKSSYSTIATIDGDGQNNPTDLP